MIIGIDARFLGKQSAGLERYTGELIREILKLDKGNNYVIFVKKNYQLPVTSYQLLKNCKIVEVNIPHYSLKEQVIFPWILHKHKLDLMHFTHFNHPLLYFKPFVINILDLTLLRHPARNSNLIKKIVMKIVLRSAVWRAKKIITISQWVKDDIVKTYDVTENKIAVTYPGVNLPVTCYPLPVTKLLAKYGIQKPYLLYVGQWRAHKNLLRLVEAFSLIKRSLSFDQARQFGGRVEKHINLSELKLVFAGKRDPLHPELPLKVKELGTEKDVIYTDYVDDEDLPVIYANAEIFVFPSLSEGFGIPVLEAMAAGTPVVCSNATSLPEVGGRTAEYFNPENIKEMAEEILRILQDKKLQSKMIESGKEQIKKFTWEKMARETLKIYLASSKKTG